MVPTKYSLALLPHNKLLLSLPIRENLKLCSSTVTQCRTSLRPATPPPHTLPTFVPSENVGALPLSGLAVSACPPLLPRIKFPPSPPIQNLSSSSYARKLTPKGYRAPPLTDTAFHHSTRSISARRVPPPHGKITGTFFFKTALLST